MFPIEEFQDSLMRIGNILSQLAVKFHVTGGAATLIYSEPRLTQDIDLVIDRDRLSSQIDTFLAAVDQEQFLFEEASVRTAVSNGKCFQLLDTKRILKFDLYPRELIRGELSRTVQMPLSRGLSIPVVALQDLVLSKFIWISHGSGKSRADLRSLWRRSNDEQKKAVRQYASDNRLSELLDTVLAESDEIDV